MADKIVTLHPYNNKSDNLYPRVLGKSVQAGTNIAIDTTANTISVAQSLIDTINGKQAKGDYATNSTLTNNYYTKSKVDDLLANKQNSGNYALKSEIPTKTSKLTNDSGYLISSDLKTSISVVSNPYDDPDDDNNTMTSLVVSVGGVSASTLTDELKVAYAKNAYSAQYAVNANNATNAIYTRYLGTSTSAYSKELLDIVFEKKQDKVKQLGNDTTPVYVSANGTFSACTDYSQASVKHADNATKATSANSAIRATYASSLGEPNSNYNYETLNSALNAKQNIIPGTGNSTTPVYFSESGKVTTASLYAGGTKVTLNGTEKSSSSASFYAPTSSGTAGFILTSGEGKGVPPTWTDPSSISVGYANKANHANSVGHATSAGSASYANALGTSSANYTKSTLDSALNAKQDKVKQLGNAITPVYVSANGTFSACTDYSQASVKHADNATKATSANSAIRATYASSLGEPDSNYNYETLNSALNAKQNTIPTTGSDTEPVYFSNAGTIAKAKLYAGGTKVKLNGSDQGGSSVSFYAPTSYGSAGSVLVCGEATNVPPKWVAPSSFSVGYANAIGFPGSSYTKEALDNALDSKQSTLVSGTNLKTVNGTSLLGSGNIAIAGNMVIGSTDIVYNNENIENGTFYFALAVSHKAVLGVYVHYLSNDPYYDEIFQTCIYNFRAEDGDPAQTGYTADFYYYGQNGLTPVPTGSTIRIVYIN